MDNAGAAQKSQWQLYLMVLIVLLLNIVLFLIYGGSKAQDATPKEGVPPAPEQASE